MTRQVLTTVESIAYRYRACDGIALRKVREDQSEDLRIEAVCLWVIKSSREEEDR